MCLTLLENSIKIVIISKAKVKISSIIVDTRLSQTLCLRNNESIKDIFFLTLKGKRVIPLVISTRQLLTIN